MMTAAHPGAHLWRPWAGVAALLAVAVALLHGNALSGGWIFDDAPQLNFAATHAPWQYFLIPEVMRQQSYAHITPFNSLFYDIGLPFFGLNAVGHHLHLLVVIWLTALAIWGLLRRWVGSGLALGGALLWLAMPPTGIVSHLVMTGHYAYGLLFSVLALAAFDRAVSTGALPWALAAAAWYALACLCKELYVPLVLVLIAWPGLPGRKRLRLTLAPIVVGAAYAAWRLHVLGGVGGYGAMAGRETLRLDPANLLSGMHLLQTDLFGRGWPGWAAVAMVLATAWAARAAPGKPLWSFMLACATALLVPVVPLLLIDVPGGFGRVALLIGFALALLVVWQLARLPHMGKWRVVAQVGTLAVLTGCLALGQRHATQASAAEQRTVKAANDFLIHADAGERLIGQGLGIVNHLLAMRSAVMAVEHRAAPVVLENDDELVALSPDQAAGSWAWQAGCQCLQRLGAAHAQRVAAIRHAWAAGAGLSLGVRARIDAFGRVKVFHWQFSGSPGQHGVEVRHLLQADLRPSGTLAFGLDITIQPPEPALLRFSVTGADGSVKRSPWMPLSISRGGSLQWHSHDTPG